jgi:hypothetical protein
MLNINNSAQGLTGFEQTPLSMPSLPDFPNSAEPAELNPSLFLAHQTPPFPVKDSVNMGSAYLHFYK